jgi:hypothetical protein
LGATDHLASPGGHRGGGVAGSSSTHSSSESDDSPNQSSGCGAAAPEVHRDRCKCVELPDPGGYRIQSTAVIAQSGPVGAHLEPASSNIDAPSFKVDPDEPPPGSSKPAQRAPCPQGGTMIDAAFVSTRWDIHPSSVPNAFGEWHRGLSPVVGALELTRSRGHLILGKTPEEGARSGSSVDLSRGVPA